MRFGPQRTPPLTDQKTHVFVEGALTPAECARLVADAAALPPETGQLIGGDEARGVRRCRVRWLPEGNAFGWVNDLLVGIVAPRATGTATVFAANVLHRVAPVTWGRRHALTAWFHGPHFR